MTTALRTAFWRREDLHGSDAATSFETATGHRLMGCAVFLHPRGPAALSYDLELTVDWKTVSARIRGFVGGTEVDNSIRRDAEGWYVNDRSFDLADIVDLDLGFTPATNMNQLKRVSMKVGETVEFDVAWMDAGELDLIRLPQKYTRLSNSNFAYVSPTVGYSGTIVLAPSGFAAEYPGIWKGVT